MTYKLKIFAASMLVLLAASCKQEAQKSSFTIEGTAQALADGTHLLLINNDGMPIDTITVSGGKFSYEGAADSVLLCTLAVENDGMNAVSFFTEPGDIKITFGSEAGTATVAGTEANDAIQKLNEEVNPFYEKIHELESLVYSDTTKSYDQWALMERYNQLVSEINKRFNEAAEKNIGNELGFNLLVSYIDPEENTELVRSLIDRLPTRFSQRPQVEALKNTLKAQEATSVGQKIADFTLDTPDGTPLSVMSEVKKNKVTILDFWASWCGPCRKEMPFMKKLYADFHAKGLGIVGISLDESAADWNRAITDLKLEWPQISDLKGWNAAPAKTFSVNSIPFMLIVDSEGKILQKGLRGEELQKFIAQQLP
ncbi:MAG: AhpC/TSA family protein [Prevotella sp.]|nr:AhpC/TSA family protein [Prevotella sp.]MBQ8711615.1 AhpC/TSA family protein [Prevotella sp.]